MEIYEKENWIVMDGSIITSVNTDGTSGEEWTYRLEANGIEVSDNAKIILKSPNFQSTQDQKTTIQIIKAINFRGLLTIFNIRQKAKREYLKSLKPETACLLREMLSNSDIKNMGLERIIIMHHPFKPRGLPVLLCLDSNGYARKLSAESIHTIWTKTDGFAFMVPPEV